jgi:hypothetical protein
VIDKAHLLEYFEGMYTDSDTDIRRYTVSVVKTRSEHNCPGNFTDKLHPIPIGTIAVVERAIVEGEWASSYTCENCVLAWRKFRGLP